MKRSFATQPLLCYAHGRGNQWEAICVDLDISVEGRSFAAVKLNLYDAVNTYLHAAMEEAEPHRTALLSRRAPLWVRAQWFVRFATWRLIAACQRAPEAAEATLPFAVSCRG